jgi:hypothetical protein
LGKSGLCAIDGFSPSIEQSTVGRIYPVSAAPAKKGKETGHLDFMDEGYPIQVKQKDKAGTPDIRDFEGVT